MNIFLSFFEKSFCYVRLVQKHVFLQDSNLVSQKNCSDFFFFKDRSPMCL
jgi:hypothetical protein